MSLPGTVVHVAGPPQHCGTYQECSRCGLVLEDFTGRQIMIPQGQIPGLPLWPEGARIGVAGNCTWTIPDDADLEPGEVPCQPAS